MESTNQAWRLESFLDALVVELDKTRETLNLKAINKALTYAVKDMSMDLQIFPTFNGDDIQFETALPGDTGASKLTIQLASITDRQVRETTKQGAAGAETPLAEVELEDSVKRDLRKIGVSTIEDLDRVEKRNVKLDSVTRSGINYSDLANAVRSAKRRRNPPKVRSAALEPSADQDNVLIRISGEALATDPSFEPVAVVNGQAVAVMNSSNSSVELSCEKSVLHPGDNDLVLVLDPVSLLRLNAKNLEPQRA